MLKTSPLKDKRTMFASLFYFGGGFCFFVLFFGGIFGRFSVLRDKKNHLPTKNDFYDVLI